MFNDHSHKSSPKAVKSGSKRFVPIKVKDVDGIKLHSMRTYGSVDDFLATGLPFGVEDIVGNVRRDVNHGWNRGIMEELY